MNNLKAHEDAKPLPAATFIDTVRGTLCDEVLALNADLLAVMQSLGVSAENIDESARLLAQKDRSLLSSVYDVVREMESFNRLIFSPRIIGAVKKILGEGPLHTPHQHAVFRMDLPGEPFRSFDWHQDFPYNMLSKDSLTVWIPLAGAGIFNGSIDVVCQKDAQLYPVDILFKRAPDGKIIGGRDAFIPREFAKLFDAECTKLELLHGDFALFGSHVVHRSGHNPGPNIRFSVQIRYGKLLDSQVVQRRWSNRRNDGFETFEKIYPALIASKEQA